MTVQNVTEIAKMFCCVVNARSDALKFIVEIQERRMHAAEKRARSRALATLRLSRLTAGSSGGAPLFVASRARIPSRMTTASRRSDSASCVPTGTSSQRASQRLRAVGLVSSSPPDSRLQLLTKDCTIRRPPGAGARLEVQGGYCELDRSPTSRFYLITTQGLSEMTRHWL